MVLLLTLFVFCLLGWLLLRYFWSSLEKTPHFIAQAIDTTSGLEFEPGGWGVGFAKLKEKKFFHPTQKTHIKFVSINDSVTSNANYKVFTISYNLSIYGRDCLLNTIDTENVPYSFRYDTQELKTDLVLATTAQRDRIYNKTLNCQKEQP